MTQDPQTARQTRVLILDEDRVEGGMLAFHLRREGLVVMLMTSAEEAADAIAWAEPDVVLVEVAARGFDGREFLSQLVHLPVDVYAVADRQLSAEVELDALRLGVIDVMMKPVDPVTLARRLKSRPERQRRGSIPDLPEGGISGDLAVHSPVHLLQMAHRHRLNARLHVEIEGDWAVLLVRHGEVIDAEAPSHAGREAAFQVIRATQGAFVLFPLAADAEELSRDDVIRADLATLVADALGRKEPRAVNVLRAREPAAFVLPHVGSPRGPLAKHNTGEETLEYAALAAATRAGEAPRVKRPGEREKEGTAEPVEAARARAEAGARALREPTMTGAPAVPSSLVAPANEIKRPDATATQPELDEGIFDVVTDQELRGSSRGAGTGSGLSGPHRRPTDRGVNSGLRRLGSGGSGLVRREGPARRSTDPELRALSGEEPQRTLADVVGRPDERRRRWEGRWSLPTIALAGATLVLAIFIVWRLASKETPVAPDISGDPQLVLGQALVDLDEGRRDQARTALAALAVEPTAQSEALATLAMMQYEDRRLVEAEAIFERLVERSPRDPVALAWLGLVEAERMDAERARAHFKRAQEGAVGPLAERLQRLVPGAGSSTGTLSPEPK